MSDAQRQARPDVVSEMATRVRRWLAALLDRVLLHGFFWN